LIGGRRAEGGQAEGLRERCRKESLKRSLPCNAVSGSGQPKRAGAAAGGLLEHLARERQSLESARTRPNVSEHGKCLVPVGKDCAADASGGGPGASVELVPALR